MPFVALIFHQVFKKFENQHSIAGMPPSLEMPRCIKCSRFLYKFTLCTGPVHPSKSSKKPKPSPMPIPLRQDPFLLPTIPFGFLK